MKDKPSKKYILIIEGDYHDGDYITQVKFFDQGDPNIDVKRIRRISQVIKDHNGSWGWTGEAVEKYKDKLSKEDIEYISDFIPSVYQGGETPSHTIKSIEIIEYINKDKLL